MGIPTKPGFLPAYRETIFAPTVRVHPIEGKRPILNEVFGVGPTNRVVVRRPSLGRTYTGEFEVPGPADSRDGFDQTAVDHELAKRGWRRTTEYDWPHGSGAYVAGIERIKR